ncbi:histidine phosphatase family protein [Marinobacter sp. 2_MG-2023]|uniref:histidine phosphatase family protein n=1 Tax=Marinobacter sp. 2_MG-2023 TaxID=3062679 RepID=UPI0026E44ACD|nr:histidine phosphatase family protein [Marinobacter sp. 2_MG-2023]MDO6443390.1 histidine phosphatase family protein [Marinobacter sp. 2_MG-2023]
MAALALIRHGEYEQLADTPSALQPYPLTDIGAEEVRQQAQRFGDWLSNAGYRLQAEIHCSTSLRAWQTAEIYRQELTNFFSAPPIVVSFSALCERSVGAVANLSVGEIERIVKLDPRFDPLPDGWKSDRDFKLPFDGAESLKEAGERVAAHLNALPLDQGDNLIQLVVGHGASIRHASFHMNVINLCDIGRLSMFYGQPVVIGKREQSWTRLYGNWKNRQVIDPID